MDPWDNATEASLQALNNAYFFVSASVTSTYVSSILTETVLFGESANHCSPFRSLVLDSTGVHSMLATVSLSVLM